ncbi:acyl carrier protein [Paenibacillus tyrfis]|uniref:acyl carrier protein n=1 Tax=Paenibacillus tyrfis TaxID=1501230 RepID=UPI001F44D167|nr:phosphopantetheine-binding protein [Paenibacillus tyrfis]
MEIASTIQKILKEQFNLVIDMEDRLMDIGINSMDYIKLIIALEVEFGFEFDDDVLVTEQLNTGSDFATMISSMIEKGKIHEI